MKTKILMLVYEPHHSGQGVHVLALAEGLNRDRYELKVICPDHNTETIAGLERVGVAVMPLPMKKLRNVGPAWRLFRAIREFQPHIFHVHGLEAGVWSRPIARLAGVPAVVYTPHTIAIRQKRWQGAYETWERVLAPLTERLIALSEGQRQQLIKKKIAEADKVVTIYNGIALTPFEQPVDVVDKRMELGIPPSHAVVTQIGRLSAQKGPGYFLEAAKIALRERREITFLMVGEGPLEEDMRRYAGELGLSTQVRFLGWRDDVPDILAVTDVSVLASMYEGLPYTLLEAMAAAKPVVVTDTDGSREVVEEGRTGFLVPPGDATALAEKILVLLGDGELRREMGKEGRRRLEKHFLVEGMVKKVEEVYDELISQRRLLRKPDA